MLKPAFFNWGKKSGGTVNENGTPAETSGETPSGFVQTEPEPADSPAPALLPSPKNTLGGNAEITYESVNGKQRTHYTQIFIDPGSLPVITGSAKPGNNEYLAVKHELLTKAYHALRGYPDFVQSLKGMHGRKDLVRIMEFVIRRFLTRFWDIPASKNHHHCYPWGLALHCLDVGCAEAEKATLWKPMSENGIDEINHSKYLGMVVLLHFFKGLFHDAHKLYQYDMKGFKDNVTVVFDPLRGQGNVLDFKLVYPQRMERWGEPFTGPGKLNALEFLGLFPKEMVKYTHTGQYIEVMMGLFDMDGTESDIESAKRDLSKIGLATMEQMILDQAEAYFTMRKEETEENAKPENNVFLVNNEWAAVSARFLMDLRPMAGHVYTKEAVKNYLQQEKALSGTAGDYDLPLLYRIKRPNGQEELSRTVAKISFARITYLEHLCPDLRTRFSRIFFDEKDRDAVLKLCPDADNFLLDLSKQVAEQPTAPETATAKQLVAAAKNAPTPDASSQEETQSAPSSAPGAVVSASEPAPVAETEISHEGTTLPHAETKQRVDPGTPAADVASATEEVPRYEAQTTADTAPESEAGCPEEPGEDQTDAIIQSILKSSSGASTPMQKIIKWENSLQRVINDYRPDYSHPATGWFYVDEEDVYVRTPIFYQKMANEDLLQHKDWQKIAESICRRLRDVGLLVLEPIMGAISFVIPGGGTGSTKGNFLKLNLKVDEHSNLFRRVLTSRPLD